MKKTIEDVLEQKYLSANDLQIIIPTLGYLKALEYIKIFRKEMESLGYFVPGGKKQIALTKLVRKRLGI